MAKGTNSNPTAAEEIRLGVVNSCLRMPADPQQRRDLIQALFDKGERLKDRVVTLKDEVGLAGHENQLQSVYGVAKATQRILKILGPLKTGDRAAVLTQTGLLSKDMGWCDKDLVTLAQEAEAQAGQVDDDQGSVFDKTTAGARLGGEPRHVEPTSTPPEPAPTPGMDLAEAQAKFEEHLAVYKAKGGKGRKPKALVEAEAAVTAAEKARTEQEHAAKAEPAEKGDPDEFDDEIPEPGSKSPLAGATGQGSYTLN